MGIGAPINNVAQPMQQSSAPSSIGGKGQVNRVMPQVQQATQQPSAPSSIGGKGSALNQAVQPSQSAFGAQQVQQPQGPQNEAFRVYNNQGVDQFGFNRSGVNPAADAQRQLDSQRMSQMQQGPYAAQAQQAFQNMQQPMQDQMAQLPMRRPDLFGQQPSGALPGGGLLGMQQVGLRAIPAPLDPVPAPLDPAIRDSIDRQYALQMQPLEQQLMGKTYGSPEYQQIESQAKAINAQRIQALQQQMQNQMQNQMQQGPGAALAQQAFQRMQPSMPSPMQNPYAMPAEQRLASMQSQMQQLPQPAMQAGPFNPMLRPMQPVNQITGGFGNPLGERQQQIQRMQQAQQAAPQARIQDILRRSRGLGGKGMR